MSNILQEIIAHKKIEIRALKKKNAPLQVKKKALLTVSEGRFYKALSAKSSAAHVIAEIKKKSPSKGILRQVFNAVAIAKAYEKGGASALSVLTDQKYFSGSADVLRKVRSATVLPILRKDFIIDEYQVYESKEMGADAVLLIAAILSEAKLASLSRLARKLDLDVLFEAHNKSDLKKIKKARPKMIGINNRNLRSFEVDIHTTASLLPYLPHGVLVVSESGIKTHEDLIYLKALGVRAVLVGESLMRQKNVRRALQHLRGKARG